MVSQLAARVRAQIIVARARAFHAELDRRRTTRSHVDDVEPAHVGARHVDRRDIDPREVLVSAGGGDLGAGRQGRDGQRDRAGSP